MRLLIDKIKKLNIGWNERVLGESDFYELCSRMGVTIDEQPMTVDGFYFRVLDRDFIAINRDLGRTQKLEVLFHEIGHLLFHVPASGPVVNFHHVGRKTRQEAEADVFALCAIIPRSLIENRTMTELIDDEHLPTAMVAARFEILNTYGI